MIASSYPPEGALAPHAAWAEQEFGSAGLGDARLDKRLPQIAAAFLSSPQALVPGACGGWKFSKATYRFFDNERVDPIRIVDSHRKQVLQRAEGESIVLAISDTTMLDYTAHPYTIGLGPLSDEHHHGMMVQPTLITTPGRVPLGVIDLQTWTRDWEDFGSGKETKRHRSIEAKESFKWLCSLEAAERFQREVGEGTQVVSVFDREGDIFDVFQTATAQETHSELLVRAKNDRSLDDSQGHLWEHLGAQDVVGTLGVSKSPQSKLDKKGREALLSVRYAEVTIKAPAHRPAAEGRDPIDVYAVFAHEETPPSGEDPISWMLLTTVPVRSAEDALEIISWYAVRWMIEILFKVLKSGCRVEERQLETYDRLRRCLAVDIVVAWYILYLTTVGRDTPDLPCTVIFEDDEWKALWVFVHQSADAVPEAPPNLRDMSRMIGRLGGHLGRKRDGEPGVVTMWRGLQRLPDITNMWVIVKPQ